MNSGGENASISVICDPDGIVRFQSVARAADDWSGGEQSTPHVGKPLVKTYWFDHLDCDHRELIGVLRKAGNGSHERVRVWLRVDEHQLIRAELTATPLVDETGQTRTVLVRTEPSFHTRRKRELGEPETRRLPSADAGPDLLQIRLSVPLLRVALESGTITGCNDACADLLRRRCEDVVGLPLSEFVVEGDRRSLIEALAGTHTESARTLDLGLLLPEGAAHSARLSLTPDPASSEPAALGVLRDLSSESVTQDLLRRADAMTNVMSRNTERLRQLEAFFDRAPVGLALIRGDEVVRANAAFEAQPRLARLAADPAANGRMIRYRAGESEEAPLAVIADVSFPAITDAANHSGQVAIVDVAGDETLQLLTRDYFATRFDTPPASLGALFDVEPLADIRSAIQAARTGEAVAPIDTRLVIGRQVRVSMARSDAGHVLLLIEDVADWAFTVDQLNAVVAQQAESIAELSAKASAIDPGDHLSAVARAADRDAQLGSLVAALDAGTFTWDVTSGGIDADARAVELLAVTGTGPLTAPGLLAAATLDERRAFEQAYFDAVSGPKRVDLSVHIGPERRPVRILGHVVLDEKDDPRALVGVVLDESDTQSARTRVEALERSLAIRNAELNAILEASRDAIRVITDGTVRHNAAAAELFSDDISAFLESPPEPDGPIVSSSLPIVVNGEALGMVSVSSDQSDALLLRRRESELAAVFANTGVAVAVLDANHQFREVNSALCALMGYAPLQLVGRPIGEFVHAEDHPTLQGEFDAINTGELQSCTSDLRLLRRDGNANWVHLTVTRPSGASRSTIVLAQDVHELHELRTRRDELRAALEEMRQQHAMIAMTVQDAVLRLSPSGQVLEANDIARRRLELNSRRDLSHLTFIAPETGNTLREPLPWTRATVDRASVVELRVTGPGELDFVGRFSSRADEAGNVAIHIADVTRIHAMQEELQKAYARIVESHTLLQTRTRQLEGNFVSAVQQLGASIASAYGSAKALRNDGRLPKPLLELARRVVDAFRVHRRLVQYYTASAATGRNAGTEERVDVHELAQQASAALAERFNIVGRLEMSLDAAEHHCRLDGAMIRHAFWSILAHAVSQATKLPARVTSTSLASTRGSGRLRVEVTWPGTRAGTAELNLAGSLIASCEGTLTVSVTEDAATAVIEFDLDAAGDESTQAPPAPRRHILLVEDHESTARVLRRQLERLGCVVSHAASLAEARSILEDQTGIDLLICDLSLPEDEAPRLITHLLRRLNTPAIALRSYGGVEPPEELAAMGFVDHLDKPVDLNALSSAIARFASPSGE